MQGTKRQPETGGKSTIFWNTINKTLKLFYYFYYALMKAPYP